MELKDRYLSCLNLSALPSSPKATAQFETFSFKAPFFKDLLLTASSVSLRGPHNLALSLFMLSIVGWAFIFQPAHARADTIGRTSEGSAAVSLYIPPRFVTPSLTASGHSVLGTSTEASTGSLKILEAHEEFGVAGIQMAVTSFDGSEKTITGLTTIDLTNLPASAAVVVVQPE